MNWWIAAGVSVLAFGVLFGVVRPLLAAKPAGRRSGFWAARRRRLVLAAGAVLCTVPLFVTAMNPPDAAEPAAVQSPAAPHADVGASLDRARRYAQEGLADKAIDEYVTVLRVDSGNAEALSSMGYLLYLAGRPEDGLWAVDEALRSAPGYAEAKYFRGAILITALRRGPEGAASLREYLAAEPDGNHRQDALYLLGLAGEKP
ncbi:hypothetical protein [Amycolatopsis sp. WGS_07]|uniref:hypothetical protein n=1 Tax=Amycolatopsis sp. WGS_07 TaxID=3076764 RepID=UPI003873C3A6